ncbi:hypothetical protein PFICI_06378 [Pestalotiopsis fici W106-1]|uniref:Uncharacterized protein n=1 Tax=Pestalotiopsis fici (strain W106-1 / CGMCC3.15140) TaxID=1229662 RepID=W3X866_PESFW|nr:uncharacterized protein PFICI_06378 [Pestalotiopsis fici W106-1]ETS81376.1 hypothetical protein PFICI_06378 [Pestalotiopsis fici W106-1]
MTRLTRITAVLFSLATSVLSATLPVVTGTASTTNLPGVALIQQAKRAAVTDRPSPPLAARSMKAPPEFLTLHLVNSHTAAVSTAHVHDVDSPPAASGNVGAGTLARGASASFAVPTGYVGNMALSEAEYPITADDTLIEINFSIAKDYGNIAVADVDVSYVNGYSVPITCSCGGSVVTGCNKDLLKLNTCADLSPENACVNPLRALIPATAASPFFAPCQGAAWTFVNDGDADAWGSCQSGQISCCIGTACPANPDQRKRSCRKN